MTNTRKKESWFDHKKRNNTEIKKDKKKGRNK